MPSYAQIIQESMSIDNTHVSKVAGLIMVALGLYIAFEQLEWKTDDARKTALLSLGWAVFGVGCAYLLFAVFAGTKLLSTR